MSSSGEDSSPSGGGNNRAPEGGIDFVFSKLLDSLDAMVQQTEQRRQQQLRHPAEWSSSHNDTDAVQTSATTTTTTTNTTSTTSDANNTYNQTRISPRDRVLARPDEDPSTRIASSRHEGQSHRISSPYHSVDSGGGGGGGGGRGGGGGGGEMSGGGFSWSSTSSWSSSSTVGAGGQWHENVTTETRIIDGQRETVTRRTWVDSDGVPRETVKTARGEATMSSYNGGIGAPTSLLGALLGQFPQLSNPTSTASTTTASTSANNYDFLPHSSKDDSAHTSRHAVTDNDHANAATDRQAIQSITHQQHQDHVQQREQVQQEYQEQEQTPYRSTTITITTPTPVSSAWDTFSKWWRSSGSRE